MKNPGKSKRNAGNGAKSEARKDRRSGSGVSGSPKKGDHGGKFTWADDGLSGVEIGLEKGASAVDDKDPNFEEIEIETNSA